MNGNSTASVGYATSPDEDMIDINTSGGGESSGDRTTRLNEDEDGISHCKFSLFNNIFETYTTFLSILITEYSLRNINMLKETNFIYKYLF